MGDRSQSQYLTKPPRPTQPGHPSMGRSNEYWQWLQPLLGVPQRRPHCQQELATLPSVGANLYSPPFPYVDLETGGFAVFLCFLVCILVKIDSR